MSWKEKLTGATIIFEILIVAPIVWLVGGMASLWSQVFSPGFDWGWLAYILVVLILNGFYAMGLLLIMGLIDFARRPKDIDITSRIKSMSIGRE